jgi:hypothetical protein
MDAGRYQKDLTELFCISCFLLQKLRFPLNSSPVWTGEFRKLLIYFLGLFLNAFLCRIYGGFEIISEVMVILTIIIPNCHGLLQRFKTSVKTISIEL